MNEDRIKEWGKLNGVPEGQDWRDISRIIAYFMARIEGKSLGILEIGVGGWGGHFSDVKDILEKKGGHYTGVDISLALTREKYPHLLSEPLATYIESTSFMFFKDLGPCIEYDFIFVDGCHEYSETFCDITSSLEHLSNRGFIIIHDVAGDTSPPHRAYHDTCVDKENLFTLILPGNQDQLGGEAMGHGEGMAMVFKIK